MNIKVFARSCVLSVAVLVVPVSWAAPPNYPALYAFGDSLSDTGNDIVVTKALSMTPAIPPSESPHRTYYQGRFSNGPVAVEYLWRLLKGNNNAVVAPFMLTNTLGKKSAVNFAFGGSGTAEVFQTPGGFAVPGLLGQVKLFRTALQGKKADNQALYVLWSGANDYLFGGANEPTVIVANITRAIEDLHALGARNFLVPNLPDMGLAPLAQFQGAGPALSQLTAAHNAVLAQSLDALSTRLGKANIMRTDVNGITKTMLSTGAVAANPPALALIAPDSGAVDCLFRNPMTCPDVNVTAAIPSLLFWDVLHPTTQVHGVLGRAMFQEVSRDRGPKGSRNGGAH